jgi:hypothetical protein
VWQDGLLLKLIVIILRTRGWRKPSLWHSGVTMQGPSAGHFPGKQCIIWGKKYGIYTRWFKYDRDDLCVNKSQFVPVIFEPPCTLPLFIQPNDLNNKGIKCRHTMDAALKWMTSIAELFDVICNTALRHKSTEHKNRPCCEAYYKSTVPILNNNFLSASRHCV